MTFNLSTENEFGSEIRNLYALILVSFQCNIKLHYVTEEVLCRLSLILFISFTHFNVV